MSEVPRLDGKGTKPIYKSWREIPVPRVLELKKRDGTVTDMGPAMAEKYEPQEKRGTRALQVGLNLYHWWRDVVTKKYGPEVAKDMVVEIGKRWGMLTADVLKGPPVFLDSNMPDDEFFAKYCEGSVRTSYPMCEIFEVIEDPEVKNKIVWKTLACRQMIPWRDGFYVAGSNLPPDPKLCHVQCDQWWEWMNKGLHPRLQFKRNCGLVVPCAKADHEHCCEWEVWLEPEK